MQCPPVEQGYDRSSSTGTSEAREPQGLLVSTPCIGQIEVLWGENPETMAIYNKTAL